MFKTYLKAIFLSIFCALNASAAHSVSLLRDPDIEYGLQQLAEPILRAANLNSDDVKVWIVNDMGLNAFIIDHTHIFCTCRTCASTEECRAAAIGDRT